MHQVENLHHKEQLCSAPYLKLFQTISVALIGQICLP